MPEDRLLRASDVEREQVVSRLADAYAGGRLTLAELESRTESAYGATTRGDLAGLLGDLPGTMPPRPAAVATTARSPRPARQPARHVPWSPWLLTAVICLVVWVATSVALGTPLYFWPVWVIGPWGVMLLLRRGACARSS